MKVKLIHIQDGGSPGPGFEFGMCSIMMTGINYSIKVEIIKLMFKSYVICSLNLNFCSIHKLTFFFFFLQTSVLISDAKWNI